jgi:hypothetical protein
VLEALRVRCRAGAILAARGTWDVEMNVNGLLPHIDIVQRDNENGDTKGGKRENTSLDAGQKELKDKGNRRENFCTQLEVRLAGPSIRELEGKGTFRKQSVHKNVSGCPRERKRQHKQAIVCERCQRKRKKVRKSP